MYSAAGELIIEVKYECHVVDYYYTRKFLTTFW